MTLIALPEHRRIERNRQRVFANDLIDALRGRRHNARIIPVVEEAIEDEIKQGKSKALFRVLGAHRTSKWQSADYTALVVSVNYAETDGTGYQLMLPDYAFERVRAKGKRKGWACGHEHFQVGRHEARTYPCEMCELLYKRAAVYVMDDDEFVRNRHGATQVQADIVDLLLEASSLTKVEMSLN